MALRDYQGAALDGVSRVWASGNKKALLWMATGGGKTVVFCEAIKRALAKARKPTMVVRGRQLVEQASERLHREGVEHGVLMGNHWNKNRRAPAQVCSIDTILARGEFPETDLLVIDEAHLFTSPGCIEFMSYYQDAYVLAVTATPFPKKPLRHLADEVVNPISTEQLMTRGYLVREEVYAPSLPDLKGVQTVAGDFQETELKKRMDVITGDLVDHWRRLGENRPTVCFAVNVAHSLEIVARFKDAGIPAEHIEGGHTLKERKEAIERLRTGEIKILSNVGVLCTGVDMPFLSCLILARPTKSYNLYIQQVGRGTRPVYACGFDPGTDHGRLSEIARSDKPNFIILDHAGNTLRHGFLTTERVPDLDGTVRPKLEGPEPKRCDRCYGIFIQACCPRCGPKESLSTGDFVPLAEEGELRKLKSLPFSAEIMLFVNAQKEIKKKCGYSRWWLRQQIQEKFGDEIANTFVPPTKDKRVAPWLLR